MTLEISKEILTEKAFKQCFDPELNIDVWTLGLIYDTKIEKAMESKEGEEKKVCAKILMTFTSPFCPYGPQLVDDLKEKIKAAGVKEVQVEVTFDPPWQPSEELKTMMGM